MAMAVQTQSVSRPATPQTAVSGGGIGNVSLYVGDLDRIVNEAQLYDLFNQVAQVVSIRVCRDQTSKASLGYAYVNFGNPQDAANAREVLNFTPINGKPMRIMFSHRDPIVRKNGSGNVFIKNLDTSIDNKGLHDTFSTFGNVLSSKVAVDSNGQSRGYGFVQFEQEEAAQTAIKQLNGMLLNDKQVYVGLFVRKQERSQVSDSPKFTNVYVKDLLEKTSDEDLMTMFAKYGSITSAVVMKDANGKSRCFGFVNFENPGDAAAAVENLNGTHLSDRKVLYVGKAQKKGEREAELKAKFEAERINKFEKLKGANLYMKNLDDSINDEKLKALFTKFGTITSCKVNVDSHGISKGSGFVAFSNTEDATRALREMNGFMVGGKPLYVAVAQCKEERRAQLQAQFAQARASGVLAPFPAGVPGYIVPGAPRLPPHQHVHLSQGSSGPMIPPQPTGYGFQQRHLPGFRPGVGPNFVVPYQFQRQGQFGQPLGLRSGENFQQMPQHQWMHPHHGFGRYMANGRNCERQMTTLPFDGSAIPAGTSGTVPRAALASALASANPETQRQMLGRQLYPLVNRLEPQNVGKVTGMLLEMDQTEVLHLIESPEALKQKVAEAMEVLRSETKTGSDVDDQIGSLSLKE